MVDLKNSKTKGIVIASIVAGFGLLITLVNFVGLLVLVGGIVAILIVLHSFKQKTAACSSSIRTAFEAQRDTYKNTIHTFCAEVVDFTTEYATNDQEATEVSEYIDGLVPNEYIHVNTERRRIRNNG